MLSQVAFYRLSPLLGFTCITERLPSPSSTPCAQASPVVADNSQARHLLDNEGDSCCGARRVRLSEGSIRYSVDRAGRRGAAEHSQVPVLLGYAPGRTGHAEPSSSHDESQSPSR